MGMMKTAMAVVLAGSAFVAAPAMAVDTVSSNDATALGAALAGTGITFTSATLSTDTQNGGFSNGASSVGFNSGVVLTTGNLSCVGSANTMGNCSGVGGVSTLTLGFTATSTQLFFNYVFASEEYPEFVNSQFNDAFSLTLNGTNYANVNLAQLPDDGGVVSINNVNGLTNFSYFRSNSGDSSLDLPIEYDGLTTVLTASAMNLVIGADYTLTFDVRDVGDTSYDSAVFIQGGSVGVVTPPSPSVPEPATWAMMIAGFGLVGYTMRRKIKQSDDAFTAKVRAMAIA